MFFFLMIRRPPRSTLDRSSAASDVYKRQDSELLNQYFKKSKSNDLFFSTSKKVSNGCYLENDEVRFVRNDVVEFSCKVSDIFIKGEHNIQNAMAVIIAAKIFCLLYTSPSPRDRTKFRFPSSSFKKKKL